MSFSSLTPSSPLILIGAGKMGGALLTGWLARGLDPKAVIVVDPAPPAETRALLEHYGVAHRTTPPEGVKARVLLLAVKPQMMGAALPAVHALVGPQTITVSIAAGTTIATLEAALGGAIVRAMPNTPAQVSRGMTGVYANAAVPADGRALVTALLDAVGEVGWVESESLIDTVTAVSGSGPAYVFLLVEALAEAGVAAGFSAEQAARFARQTIIGAGELLNQSDLPADILRKNVTSPNGTTAVALAVLMDADGFGPLLGRAVAAAKRRAEELAG
ncbi:pyrroline-5-carboxylate reductase [Kaistia dalseonensis]|uniref:Pyrroline-5-carboxylate reductase n=1 Tax=Kaistia dalseonensis TaxID=410840 RepID=A0ABU0H6V4_9HYPH|nr:pyrroline-5-carboxylate reductase [Kaistia dalseonensis]MCX5495173.1 pyrroline-5-carboxylate reductase [Kaistia dalseonensis]MDQ0437757.1 pyrroline-5-carboxylate reductase [Kaistia dalseonensis]